MNPNSSTPSSPPHDPPSPPSPAGAAGAAFQSAVSPQLRRARTLATHEPAQHSPPPGTVCAVWSAGQQLVLLVLGAQSHSGPLPSWVLDAPLALFAGRDVEVGSSRDAQGREARAVVAYFASVDEYARWRAHGFDAWWASSAREAEAMPTLSGSSSPTTTSRGQGHRPGTSTPTATASAPTGGAGHGWFREVLAPTADRIEAMPSAAAAHAGAAPEGASRLASGGLAGPVREAGYWGATRDRLPAAQTDPLAGQEWCAHSPRESTVGGRTCGRVRVPGKRNLVFTRFGQDLRGAGAEEKALYRRTLGKELETCMCALRDHPRLGCYSNRFMRHLVAVATDAGWEEDDYTFALSYFDDLASLEAWARADPRHLAVYSGLGEYIEAMGSERKLRLWHETFVLTAEQQDFEYINCPVDTGMLCSLC